MSALDDVREWEARGRRISVDGRSVWLLDVPALDDRGLDPLLVLHGFPSCSFDWRHVLDDLRACVVEVGATRTDDRGTEYASLE